MTATANYTVLSSLVTRVRRRSDQENSTFVSDAELEQYIQESYFELYDLLIEAFGPEQFLDTYTSTTVAGTDTYALRTYVGEEVLEEGQEGADIDYRPLNIYKTLGLDVDINGFFSPIRPGTVYDRGHKGDDTQGWSTHGSPRYFLTTDIAQPYQCRRVHFYPTPRAAHNWRLLYIPTPVPLSDAADATGQHFLHYAHWDEYIVLDAAAKVMEKEESDSTPLLRRLEAMRQRIRDQAHTMNTETGGEIRDVYARPSRNLRGEPWV